MPKLLVGPLNKGLRSDVTAFNVDNDSFPTLFNAYQWRSRVKRKRGTELLSRLQRFFDSTSTAFNPGSVNQTLSSGVGTLLFSSWGIETGSTIVPGSISIIDTTDSNQEYTDDSDGILTGSSGGSGTINYATGSFTIASGASHVVTASFYYYPILPVLGLEPFVEEVTENPTTLAFDTTYSYILPSLFPYTTYANNFYWNPASSGTYVQKTTWTSVKWNLNDYQQIWSTNYQGALWATPGIPTPFDTDNLGMQYLTLTSATLAMASTTDVDFVVDNTPPNPSSPLVAGDWVFINEVSDGILGLNYQTGYVLDTPAPTATTFTARFANATLSGTAGTGGIAQTLTNSAFPTKDCIRWYNGNPISTPGDPSGFSTVGGWVNFCPPLSRLDYGVGLKPSAIYYLVSAKIVIPFKDRALFFGAVIQDSSNNFYYLQDTAIWSENGTPYYTCSFPYTGQYPTIQQLVSPSGPIVPYLVPFSETALPQAFWQDVQGFGGFLSAGYSRPITSASPNEDVLIVGFADRQARFAYTSNDLLPFAFFIINSELGSEATFSTVTLDRGVLSVGGRGIIITSQISSQRIDLEIPDDIFQISLVDAGTRRISSQRDFINEWVYFTYPYAGNPSRYPTQTFLYNYRDNSWAIFGETYTTYGSFRKQSGTSWDDLVDFSWDEWNTPWDSGASTTEQPLVIGGNQQGFILVRDTETTDEDPSLYIASFTNPATITSPDHCLNAGDYVLIEGCIGTIGPYVNGRVYRVDPQLNQDTLIVSPALPGGDLTYLGGGTMTRFYRPMIMTKQFPTAWDMGRKTRLGMQQYLFTYTDLGQISLLIFLSQDITVPYNLPPIVPSPNSVNESLIYSTILYTCPESSNIGLDTFQSNLQTPTAQTQSQIWHRMNTSLIGDTVQIGFTLSDDQMATQTPSGEIFEITGVTNDNPCVLSTTANFPVGTLVQLSGLVGSSPLNFNSSINNWYYVSVSTTDSMTILVDSTLFPPYISGGEVQKVSPIWQVDEIELHSFILDVTPSQLLV